MPLAYSYIRFSSKPQELGDSLRRQIEGTEAFCLRHKLTLDTSVTLQDLGVSGFRGKNRDKGALAEFLRLAERGSIPVGSFLVLENLDRLSREDLRSAFGLLLRILDCKVNVATVAPEQIYRHDSLDQIGLMVAIIELSRGHSESAIKSSRSRANWQQKRQAIATNVFTENCPGWLRVVDGRFEVIEERTKVIREVFRLSHDGWGFGAIAKKMNSEEIPPPTRRGTTWHDSTVSKLLHNRALFGEYQLCEGREGKRLPVGKPIPNYFPVVIDEERWYSVQDDVQERKSQRGPCSGDVNNLFTGLLWDATDNCSMYIEHKDRREKSKKKPFPTIVSSRGKRGVKDSRYITFPYPIVEEAVLKCTRELQAADLAPDKEDVNEMASVSGRLTELDNKIERTKVRYAAAKTEDEETQWAGMLSELSAERAGVVQQLQELKQRAANGYGEALGDAQSIISMMDEAEDKREFRLRLRARLNSLISRIWVVVVPLGPYRTCPKGLHLQIDFRNGAMSRHIITRSTGSFHIHMKQDVMPHRLPENVEELQKGTVKFWKSYLRPTRSGGVRFKSS